MELIIEQLSLMTLEVEGEGYCWGSERKKKQKAKTLWNSVLEKGSGRCVLH